MLPTVSIRVKPSVARRSPILLLVGDSAVGKTSLVAQLKGDPFQTKYTPTVGTDVHPFSYGNDLPYLLYDLGGSAKGSVKKMIPHQKTPDLYLLMFDLTNKSSHESLAGWRKELRNLPGGSSTPTILLGNKSDSTERRMDEKEITFHLKERLPYFEVSAKTGEDVQSLLDYFFWTTGHI
jgi:small GTP-binding protein